MKFQFLSLLFLLLLINNIAMTYNKRKLRRKRQGFESVKEYCDHINTLMERKNNSEDICSNTSKDCCDLKDKKCIPKKSVKKIDSKGNCS